MASPVTSKNLIPHPPTEDPNRAGSEVKLVAAEDRKLRIKVECRDDKEIVGTGFH